MVGPASYMQVRDMEGRELGCLAFDLPPLVVG